VTTGADQSFDIGFHQNLQSTASARSTQKIAIAALLQWSFVKNG